MLLAVCVVVSANVVVLWLAGRTISSNLGVLAAILAPVLVAFLCALGAYLYWLWQERIIVVTPDRIHVKTNILGLSREREHPRSASLRAFLTKSPFVPSKSLPAKVSLRQDGKERVSSPALTDAEARWLVYTINRFVDGKRE